MLRTGDVLQTSGGRLRGVVCGLMSAAGMIWLSSCGPAKGPQAATQPITPAAQPAGADNVHVLFNAKTLEGWKVPEWGGSGKVYVKGGAVHMEMGESCTGITYTGKIPREDYEVSMEGMRVDGHDFFCGLTFPVGKDPMTLILGGWGGTVVGLSCLDGEDASGNETSQMIDFDQNRWYRVRVRVTKAKVQAFLDDKKIIDVNREGRKIGIRWEVEPSVPLGIATWRTHGAARNIQIRELDEEEK